MSGADSRTAVADSSGGKTQFTTLVAAVVMAVVLLFLTTPLAYVPAAALAAILITSAIGLFDVASMRHYYRISKPEFRQSVVAMIGVMTLGVLPGVLIAVGLAILKLLRQASRPRDEVLGVYGNAGDDFRSEVNGGQLIPGVVIYRFQSALVFFNADYFADRVRSVINEASEKPRSLLLDAESMPFIDVSGVYTLQSLHAELAERGIVLVLARVSGPVYQALESAGALEGIGKENFHHTIHAGIRKFHENGTSKSPYDT